MKVRAQIAMVLNLDKCIGCHTCSVTCKQVWTSREGVEYAWFNNVETKPGIGYPKDWENQDKWKGGWKRKRNGKIQPRIGAKWRILANIFANPNLPEIDDYYEPFTFDYAHLQTAPESRRPCRSRARSVLHHRRADGDQVGPELGGDPRHRIRASARRTATSRASRSRCTGSSRTPSCSTCRGCASTASTRPASPPARRGRIYKREEDGIVLIDQEKCRGWRMCVSACPYKKIYYNWQSGKAEKCIFCYPRIEAGEPTVCSETCVGRIRYLGVLLYDADRIEEAASVENEQQLYRKQLDIFLDPSDPKVIEQARARWRARGLARGRAQQPDLQDVHRLADRLPAAPRIPHAADGLVRAAALAGAVRGRGRPCRLEGRPAGHREPAHPGEVPRQPADRGGRGAGGAGPAAHDGDAHAHARAHRREPRGSRDPGARSA